MLAEKKAGDAKYLIISSFTSIRSFYNKSSWGREAPQDEFKRILDIIVLRRSYHSSGRYIKGCLISFDIRNLYRYCPPPNLMRVSSANVRPSAEALILAIVSSEWLAQDLLVVI